MIKRHQRILQCQEEETSGTVTNVTACQKGKMLCYTPQFSLLVTLRANSEIGVSSFISF